MSSLPFIVVDPQSPPSRPLLSGRMLEDVTPTRYAPVQGNLHKQSNWHSATCTKQLAKSTSHGAARAASVLNSCDFRPKSGASRATAPQRERPVDTPRRDRSEPARKTEVASAIWPACSMLRLPESSSPLYLHLCTSGLLSHFLCVTPLTLAIFSAFNVLHRGSLATKPPLAKFHMGLRGCWMLDMLGPAAKFTVARTVLRPALSSAP